MKLLIAEDHPVFRKGLKDILQDHFKDASILECDNGSSALQTIEKEKPDLSILDINMPEMNGMEVCKQVMKKDTSSKVIILTMYREKEMIRKAMDCGASGYLLKDNSTDEIIACINKVMVNEKYIGSALEAYNFEVQEEDKKKKELIDQIKTLSQSELKTLKLVSNNRSTKEIAELLFLSEKTVENYRSRICQKLGLPPRNNSLLMWVAENKQLLQSISEF